VARILASTAITEARVIAQDDDTNNNYAVSDTKALAILNFILADWSTNIGARSTYIPASNSGLTWSAGDVTKVMSGTPSTFLAIEAIHPHGSNSLTYPLAPPLERVTVEQMMEMLQYDGDNALAQQASEWTHYAAEVVNSDQAGDTSLYDLWRIWAYPVINRTRHMVMKVVPLIQCAASTKNIDLDEGDSRIVVKLLAWEMARLKKENSQEFLNNILSMVPKEIINKMHRGGPLGQQLQSAVEWRDW
jgi:hypothetical protein